jgi:ribosomal protein S6
MDSDTLNAELDGAGVIDTEGDETLTSVYEIGYHLVPSIAEEALPGAVTPIMDLLKSEGANFVGERFPSKIQLAYPIAKRIQEKRTSYDSAYFGWVAFEAPREAVLRIKTALDANPNVLRYLIVATDREAVAAAMSGMTAPVPTGTIDKPKRSDEEAKGELSETALDEALKDIATEDAKTASD